MAIALTEKFVQNAKSTAKQTDYFDALTTGLALCVSRLGRKTWSLTFSSPTTAKRARIVLGTYPATSLQEARTRAVEARGQVERGIDPRDAARAASEDKNVSQLIEDRMKRVVDGKLRSAASVRRRYEKNVIPVVGHIKVKDFQIRHLNMVVDPIMDRGAPIEANRVFEDVRALLNFAVRRGEIPYSTLAKAEAPAPKVVRTHWLTTDEIVTLWKGAPSVLSQSQHVPTILRLLLATGQRLGEVAGMARSEIDLAKRLWTIPGARAKNGHEHAVPLSDLAFDLAEAAMGSTNSAYLFPNRSMQAPLDNHAVDRTVNRAQDRFGIRPWTPHDLRRTVATQMSRRENGLAIPHLYISHVLNHRSSTRSSITQAVYDQNDFLDEKREALDKWAAFLSRLLSPDNVVSIGQVRALA